MSEVRLVEPGEPIPWDDLRDGPWARTFLEPMLRDGVTPYVGNVHTELRVLIAEGHVLPLTVNPGGETNAWVVSPRNAYIDYAAEELREVDSGVLRASLKGAIGGLGAMVRAGRIDRVVHVDNWLLSTNLHPELSRGTVAAIQRLLRDRWPDHAHAWRSVHAWRGEPLPEHLAGLGYQGVPARSCWVWDPRDRHHRGARDIKRDRRLLRDSGYEVVDADGLTDGDAPRLRALYDALYLDKYSKHNPWFTDAFVRMALAGGLTVRALCKDGRLDGVVGFVIRAGFMTTPLFGYDTSLPIEVGLYRMCSQLLIESALERDLILHQSAGAASFKRNRRAESVLEHTFVDTTHLPLRRRAAWTVLREAMERVAVPIVRARGL